VPWRGVHRLAPIAQGFLARRARRAALRYVVGMQCRLRFRRRYLLHIARRMELLATGDHAPAPAAHNSPGASAHVGECFAYFVRHHRRAGLDPSAVLQLQQHTNALVGAWKAAAAELRGDSDFHAIEAALAAGRLARPAMAAEYGALEAHRGALLERGRARLASLLHGASGEEAMVALCELATMRDAVAAEYAALCAHCRTLGAADKAALEAWAAGAEAGGGEPLHLEELHGRTRLCEVYRGHGMGFTALRDRPAWTRAGPPRCTAVFRADRDSPNHASNRAVRESDGSACA
jgi:hypothetical protein